MLYRQLFVLLVLRTLDLTHSQAPPLPSDLAIFVTSQTQMLKLVEIVSRLAVQNNLRLDRMETTLISLREEVKNNSKISEDREKASTSKLQVQTKALQRMQERLDSLESLLQCQSKCNDTLPGEPVQRTKVFTIISNKTMNWFGALAECRRQGLRLATIESEEEQQEVVNLINSQVGPEVVGNFWLSGSDLEQTGHYVWMTTGEPLNYTAWHEGQPDNARLPAFGEVEHCLSVRGDKDHKWNDLVCSWDYFYICDNRN